MNRHGSAAGRRLLGCLLALPLALAAWAVENGQNQQSDVAALLRNSVVPLTVDKSGISDTLNQQQGVQAGALFSNFQNATSGGEWNSRNLIGSGRSITARGLLDEPQANGPTASRGAGVRGLNLAGSRAASRDDKTGQFVYLQQGYKSSHFNITGAYANADRQAMGLTEITQQMGALDPTGAKLLNRGMRHADYAANFSQGAVSMSSKLVSDSNDQDGHAQNGLARETHEHKLGLALTRRQQLEFSSIAQADAWDQTRAAGQVDHKTSTQLLRFSSKLGRQSDFALAQTLTGAATGAQQTDVRENAVNLKWCDWKTLALTGSYAAKRTAQTCEAVNALNLGLNFNPSSRLQLTGKLVDSNTRTPGVQKVDNDLLDLKLVTKVLPTLQLTNIYQQSLDPTNGKTINSEHLAQWALTSRWTASTHLIDCDNSLTGLKNRCEYGLVGQVGEKAQPADISLRTRHDDLPLTVGQDRYECTYTRAFAAGTTAPKLCIAAGSYDLQTGPAHNVTAMGSVQLLGLKLGAHTTFSCGHYEGPVLQMASLSYRGWGQKVQSNQDVWQPGDLYAYRETGAELVHALTRTTKVVLKQFHGNTETLGAQDAVEYGAEQQLGRLNLQGGRRFTTQPANTVYPHLQESWWKALLPTAKPLPAWAATSVANTVFLDSTTWGIGQMPVWVAKVDGGLTLMHSNCLVNSAPADETGVNYAQMVTPRLFAQVGYQHHPRKVDQPAVIDPLNRRLYHLRYLLTPTTSVYGLYLDDRREDLPAGERIHAFGIIRQATATTRFQLQLDALVNQTDAVTINHGAAYTFICEHKVSDDNLISIKSRVLPRNLVPVNDQRVRVEASFKRLFD